MRGEDFLIRKKLLEEDSLPIPDFIRGVPKEKILNVIMDEYHKEWIRKLNFSEENCIYMVNIGSFFTKLSKLKGYTRTLVERIRALRKRLEILSQDPNFVKENSMTWYMERDLTQKLGFAWKQIDQRRELMIMRYLRYVERLKFKGQEHKIKYDYSWYPYKFLSQYSYNDKIFKHREITK